MFKILMEKKGRVIGLLEGVITSTINIIIEKHSDLGVQVFNRSREEILEGVNFRNMPDNETYEIIKSRVAEYIDKNFKGADERCFPGSLSHEHREKLLEYVRQGFE